MKIKDIVWVDEFNKFKKSYMQHYAGLDRFKFVENQHPRFEILPIDFDIEDNDILPSGKDFEVFMTINYGWDMWCGALLERCEDWEFRKI